MLSNLMCHDQRVIGALLHYQDEHGVCVRVCVCECVILVCVCVLTVPSKRRCVMIRDE